MSAVVIPGIEPQHTDCVVLADGLAGPEGPAFTLGGDLWLVELAGGNLVRWTEAGLERVPTGGRPNGIAIDAGGRLWFCDRGQNAVRRYSPDSHTFETVAATCQGVPLNKPNDLAFDSVGNLVFTCPGDSMREPTGNVCCKAADGRVAEIASGLCFPNGLAFVEEGRKLVVAETFRQRLWIGEWDPGQPVWHSPRPWFDTGGTVGPDGMALGEDGLLYVAIYGLGQVSVVDLSGRLVRTLAVPGSRPTNVAFDPSGRLGLIVTEGERGQLLSYPGMGRGAVLYYPSVPAKNLARSEPGRL